MLGDIHTASVTYEVRNSPDSCTFPSQSMSTTGENHPLLPDTFSIAPLETWADAIQLLSFEAERCFLQKVEHYKALSDMEHEFLVVYASHPSGSQIVLGVDRNGPLSSLCAPSRYPRLGLHPHPRLHPRLRLRLHFHLRRERTSRTTACKSRTTAPLCPSSPTRTRPVSRSTQLPFHPPPLPLPFLFQLGRKLSIPTTPLCPPSHDPQTLPMLHPLPIPMLFLRARNMSRSRGPIR
ncbi:hypothetical protein BGY98DRAFT_250181 [Russula aff. rugulosa BPL654]|nr:hypothetical protein BGY98DRAFT_250181 [Russula aff. rugulosa BPL654]